MLLVEHPPLVRRALVARLALELDLLVLAEASHQSEAVHRANTLHPDVVVLDAEMPNLDVPTTVRRLHARCPSSRIVLLTLNGAAAGVVEQSGDAVPIVVGKHEGIEALLDAIRTAGAHAHHAE